MATRTTAKTAAAPAPQVGPPATAYTTIWVHKRNVPEVNGKVRFVRVTKTLADTLVAAGSAQYLYGRSGRLKYVEGTEPTGWNPPAPPTLSNLAPNTAVAGTGEPLTFSCNGAGFYTGSVVMFGVEPLPTAYVSTSQVRGTIPANLLAGAQTVQVTVSNGPGLVSGAKPFTITAAE